MDYFSSLSSRFYWDTSPIDKAKEPLILSNQSLRSTRMLEQAWLKAFKWPRENLRLLSPISVKLRNLSLLPSSFLSSQLLMPRTGWCKKVINLSMSFITQWTALTLHLLSTMNNCSMRLTQCHSISQSSQKRWTSRRKFISTLTLETSLITQKETRITLLTSKKRPFITDMRLSQYSKVRSRDNMSSTQLTTHQLTLPQERL